MPGTAVAGQFSRGAAGFGPGADSPALIRGALGGQPVGELELELGLKRHGGFLVGAVGQL